MAGEMVIATAVLPDRPGLAGTRRRLFEAALLLFGERGYHAVSMRDLAGALGLQPGALYTHISSKQQLLFELVSIGYWEHRDRLRAALPAAASPAEQLRALTRAHVLVHLDYTSLARVTTREARSLTELQQAEVLHIRAESEQLFLAVITRGVELGDFDEVDPWLAMAAIGAMGLRTPEWWTPASARSAEAVAETYATFAVRLLTR